MVQGHHRQLPQEGHRCRKEPSEHFASCFDSHCCKDAHGFGCFRKPDKEYAECLPFSHMLINGSCHDSAKWLCPDTWLQSPPPPVAPSPPPPPLAAGAEPIPRCHSPPSDHFSSCFESHCCKDVKGFACFKKRGKDGAQCLPRSHQRDDVTGHCVDSDTWLCPNTWIQESPPPAPPPPPPPPYHARCRRNPSPHYSTCLESNCCQDAKGWGCFHRTHKQFAQCLPFAHMNMTADGGCMDTDEWLCPQTWIVPPPPPAPRPPPKTAEGCVSGTTPSAHFSACTHSRKLPPTNRPESNSTCTRRSASD
jgi:hypothetical protein